MEKCLFDDMSCHLSNTTRQLSTRRGRCRGVINACEAGNRFVWRGREAHDDDDLGRKTSTTRSGCRRLETCPLGGDVLLLHSHVPQRGIQCAGEQMRNGLGGNKASEAADVQSIHHLALVASHLLLRLTATGYRAYRTSFKYHQPHSLDPTPSHVAGGAGRGSRPQPESQCGVWGFWGLESRIFEGKPPRSPTVTSTQKDPDLHSCSPRHGGVWRFPCGRGCG
ncbi:hypothetical protein DE146DRAFT_19742 [Phaeosphaeria sp. MPI-PUGE-AT-0046c]|nr:hypothetical protein DE146DRAFT_19742 [Phaeosphaeria sp. MPI-PUGE-AT-0046c]